MAPTLPSGCGGLSRVAWGGHLLGEAERKGRHFPAGGLAGGGQSWGTFKASGQEGQGLNRPHPVHLLPALGSCPMQLPSGLSAHTRCSVSVAIEPRGMY